MSSSDCSPSRPINGTGPAPCDLPPPNPRQRGTVFVLIQPLDIPCWTLDIRLFPSFSRWTFLVMHQSILWGLIIRWQVLHVLKQYQIKGTVLFFVSEPFFRPERHPGDCFLWLECEIHDSVGLSYLFLACLNPINPCLPGQENRTVPFFRPGACNSGL